MNIVTRMAALIERRALGNLPIGELDRMMDLALSGPITASGIAISPERALYLTPVYAAVRVLSEALASCPFITYRRVGNGRQETPEHILYDVLRWEPNPEQTAFEFWEMAMGHLLLWGNFYAEIERNPYGVVAVWPLRPDRMAIVRDADDRLVYLQKMPDGSARRFEWDEMFHVRGKAILDATCGCSGVWYGREAIGLGLAAEAFGARFFGNDSRPGGVLQTAGRLSKEAAGRLKESWEAAHRGGNQHRIAVLEEGVTWQTVGVPPEQAQFLETRKFQRTEIAALFGVPPHMIGDLERATFSNIEHQSIEFVTHSIEPWTTRIEQVVRRDLFRISAGKRLHFAEFQTDILKRGDQKTRSEALAVQRQNGIINANEWRELEGLNPISGEAGSAYLVNGNMITVDRAVTPPEPPAPPEPSMPALPVPAEPGTDMMEAE